MDTVSRMKALLDYYEGKIDLAHVRKVKERNLNALQYKEVDHIPLSICVTPDFEKYPLFLKELTMTDPAAMLYNELVSSFGSIMTSMEIGDDFLYQVRSNHGIGIISSMFGAECQILEDNMPWVEPIEDRNKLNAIVEKGVPDLNSGLGRQVFETYAFFRETLAQYPVCNEAIAITQPDMQGPFDIAHLLMGTEIFYALYDEPEFIHDLLNVITETYIAFGKKVNPMLTGILDGFQIVHGGLFGGYCLIKDDTAAINLSEEFYQEFAVQYNNRVFEALGGGSLHHCGVERPWHYKNFRHPLLKGLNFGNPESHDLASKMQQIGDDRVPIITWGNDLYEQDIMDAFYRVSPKTGISLSLLADSVDEGKALYQKHLAHYNK